MTAGRRLTGRADTSSVGPSLLRRVVFVQWNGNVGGAEVLSMNLVAAMRRHGVDANVLFITTPGELGERLAQMGVTARALGCRRGRDVLLRPRYFASAVTSCGAEAAILPECGFIGGALRVGGYHGHIVGVEHGGVPVATGLRTLRGIGVWLARVAAARLSDAEIAVSDATLSAMQAGPHARRIERIYNGAEPLPEPSRSRQTDGDIVVGFAGRLVEEKGVDVVLKAIAEIRHRIRIRLLVAGCGPEHGRLLALAEQLSISDSVEFLGMVAPPELLWTRCDVAVVPSRRPEGFGLAALEAMACGLPVIASRIGGLPEVVAHDVTGTLVAPDDVRTLSAALMRYADDPGLCIEHGDAGWARMRARFTVDQCADAYINLLRRLPCRW